MFRRKRPTDLSAVARPPEPSPEQRRERRRREIAWLRRDAARYRICMTCRGLFETQPPGPGSPRQRCRCDRSRSEGWTGDLAERVHLCKCCRLELLPSGSRWHVWFCAECLERVGDLNAYLGRYVIPIGRHSMMGGIGVPGKALADANEEQFRMIVEALHTGALGWLKTMKRLDAFAGDRVAYLARRVELDHLTAIPLDTWFERIDALEHPYTAFGKAGAFRALVRWFADTRSRDETPDEEGHG